MTTTAVKSVKPARKKVVPVAEKTEEVKVAKPVHHEKTEEILEVKREKHDKKLPYLFAVGKRKTAVARVRLYLKDARTDLLVDGKDYLKRFPFPEYHQIVEQPLKKLNLLGKYFISVKVAGGGIRSQAEAVRHGISRALLKMDESLRKTLRGEGWLTRDSRKKERKKPGLKRARRAPQFAKR